MVKNGTSLFATLFATTFLTSGSVWAANAAPGSTAPVKEAAAMTEQAAVDKDVGKISADGATAFANIMLTRRAIFEGRTDDAKKYVALAESGFNKAKGEDTVYNKAEAELKLTDGNADSVKAATEATTPPPDKGAPIAWVPVDASITIAEDITGNAAKTAAVGDADKALQTGDHDAAIKTLKVAGIEVAIVLAVMPLEATIDKVHKAAVMIDSGKYYEGSQELRLAESGERFDAIDTVGTPKK